MILALNYHKSSYSRLKISQRVNKNDLNFYRNEKKTIH